MSSTDLQRFHAVIAGRVQGVSFRYYTTRRAKELQLHGWVRNRSDGTVEVEAEGEREDLKSLLQFLHQGPSSAVVKSVSEQWLDYEGTLQPFAVTY